MAHSKLTKIVWFTFGWAIVGASSIIAAIVFNWEPKPETATPGLILICLMGALGGYLRCIHAFTKGITDDETSRWIWLIESLLTPLKGAGLAIIVTLLLQVGVMNPSFVPSESGDSSGINWIGLYAISGLVGLFANEAVNKLESIIGNVFN